jgi:hypothetical protein
VRTWSYDSDGDFTHTAEQWNKKAWLRPREEDDRLILNVLTPRSTTLSKLLYAIYHGRFIEMLLNHFDGKFKRASASAFASSGDVVKGCTGGVKPCVRRRHRTGDILASMRKLLALALIGVAAFAADITGTWTAAVELDAGNGSATFVLKQTGGSVVRHVLRRARFGSREGDGEGRQSGMDFRYCGCRQDQL